MNSRLYLIAIGLIGLLIAAVPVSSQDVANMFGHGMIGDGSGRLYESFRDTSFRDADSVPIRNVSVYDTSAQNEAAYNGPERIEPLIELLPPVEQPQAISVAPLPADNGFERIQTPQPAAILDAEILAPIEVADGKPVENGKPVKKKTKPTPKLWSGNVEFGLDGTEGNSQTFNIHIGFDLKRKTKANIFTTSLDYNKSNSNAVDTANRFFHESRLERPHCATPLTWYVHESTDYDEFQPWDVQINADTGIGYQVIESDATDLTGRFGGGCSHEIGGLDDTYVPELLFGMEFEHRISDIQKIKLSLEYFPNVTDFAEFRMVDKASWEILLNKKLNLSLSLNATETFNRPNPGGKEGDLDYSSVLLWNF